jgi:hypothetical protein
LFTLIRMQSRRILWAFLAFIASAGSPVSGAEASVTSVQPEAAPIQVEPELDLRLLRSQAQDYIAYRRGRLNARKKLSYVAECLAHPGVNLFCAYLPENRSRPGEVRADGSLRKVDPFQLAEVLEKADPAALATEFQGLTESQVHRALKNFPNWEPLQKAADWALSASRCPSTQMLAALGQKAEEFFPDEKYRAVSARLYARASAGGDYVSRALYWRAHCAREAGRKMEASTYYNRLLKENPLSYHGLLLGRRGPVTISRLLAMVEPETRSRSVQKPEFNNAVVAAETLHELRAHDLAIEMLDLVSERMDSAELPFRLYAASLISKSGGSIGQFRLLSSVFREDPSLISRSTLELFYPLRRFEIIREYGARIDPFLVAALIRQESGFNERAQSPAGAMGLMQLMPGTARRFERVSRRQLLNPRTNVKLGVKYFTRLLAHYGNDAELALAAYNAGPERVDEWRRRYPVANRTLFMDLIPYRETRNYVALIARNYFWYRSLYPEQAKARVRRSPTFTLFNSM